MAIPTPAEIRNALSTLRNSEVAPLGTMSLDVVAALLIMLVNNGGTGGGGGGTASSVSLQDGTTATNKLSIASDGTIRLGGAQRTLGYTLATSAGTITAGAIEIGVANIGNAAATVLGASLPANTSIGWAARQGDTLAAVAYDATGTQLIITTQR